MTKESKEPRAGSNAWLVWAYKFIRKEYFHGYKLPQRLPIEWARLPNAMIARVRWTRGRGTERKYIPLIMQIDRRLKGNHLQKQVGMSIIHEMAHLVLGVEVACEEWDGKFDKLMFKLCRRGAFRRFW